MLGDASVVGYGVNGATLGGDWVGGALGSNYCASVALVGDAWGCLGLLGVAWE